MNWPLPLGAALMMRLRLLIGDGEVLDGRRLRVRVERGLYSVSEGSSTSATMVSGSISSSSPSASISEVTSISCRAEVDSGGEPDLMERPSPSSVG